MSAIPLPCMHITLTCCHIHQGHVYSTTLWANIHAWPLPLPQITAPYRVPPRNFCQRGKKVASSPGFPLVLRQREISNKGTHTYYGARAMLVAYEVTARVALFCQLAVLYRIKTF